MKIIYFTSVFFFILLNCTSSKKQFDENGILSDGNLSLTLKKKVTYELPITFRPNGNFTTVFFDNKTQKEYITFGNDYAIDSLYFFDLNKGGKPIQTTPINQPTPNIKGVKVISLDSIFLIPKTEKSINLVNSRGVVFFSKPYNLTINDSVLNLTAPSIINYHEKTQKLFFDIEINDWDFNEKDRFIAMKKFQNGIRKHPWIISIDELNEDSLKSKIYASSFYSRFIDSNSMIFPLALSIVEDSNIIITSAYSDSIYMINHITNSSTIKSFALNSTFFDTLKCQPARLKIKEDASSMDYLASRSKSNKISSIHYFKPLDCYLVSISSKATSFNNSGNPTEFENFSGMMVCDKNFKKIGEFKFDKINKYGICKSGVLMKKTINKNSPNYDPRKIEMEIYELSR